MKSPSENSGKKEEKKEDERWKIIAGRAAKVGGTVFGRTFKNEDRGDVGLRQNSVRRVLLIFIGLRSAPRGRGSVKRIEGGYFVDKRVDISGRGEQEQAPVWRRNEGDRIGLVEEPAEVSAAWDEEAREMMEVWLMLVNFQEELTEALKWLDGQSEEYLEKVVVEVKACLSIEGF